MAGFRVGECNGGSVEGVVAVEYQEGWERLGRGARTLATTPARKSA
jgi:hypothetical protein